MQIVRVYALHSIPIKIMPSSKDPVFVKANSCLWLDEKSLCLRTSFFVFLGVYVLSSTLNGPCELQEKTYKLIMTLFCSFKKFVGSMRKIQGLTHTCWVNVLPLNDIPGGFGYIYIFQDGGKGRLEIELGLFIY